MSGTFQGRIAFASIRDVGTGTPTFRNQSGDFASVTLVAPGTIELTYATGSEIDPSECVFSMVSRGRQLTFAVSSIGDTFVQIGSALAGVATSDDFDLTILVKPQV